MSFLKTVTGLAKKGSYDLIPAEYRTGDLPFLWEDTTFENGHVFTYKDHLSSLKAYQKCPPLAAIINRMAQAYINGRTWVMDTQGKEATTADAKKIRALMKKPNPLQTWKEFEAQQQIYIDLYGWCLLLPIVPFGFESRGAIDATSMWNIPPHMLTVEETSKIFYQTDLKGIVSKVKMNYRNNNTELQVDKLYIFRDFTPSDKTLVFPESRICSLEMPINNIIGAYESRNVLINYRGALGVFTQEPNRGQFVNKPMSPLMKEELQKQFMRYGLKNRQWKFIISEASVKWQQIGIPTRDLMLFEEVTADVMAICDQYGYPSPLINTEKGPAVSNTKEFKAQLYQDCVIPKAESNYEQWNQVFKTETINLKIEKDYSKIAVMQEDEKVKWEARRVQGEALANEWKLDMITRNRFLFLIGEDTLGESGDIYYSDYQRQQTSLNPPPEQVTQPAADKF